MKDERKIVSIILYFFRFVYTNKIYWITLLLQALTEIEKVLLMPDEKHFMFRVIAV